MRLLNLTITGFSAFRDRVELDLSQISLAAVVGANHSGKTSIFQAIDYALYGPTKGSAASLINRGSTSMSVQLTFSSGGSTYVVTRSHTSSGKSQKLSLFCDGVDVSSRDLASTTATLISAIGMSRTVSLATWMSMQGEIDYLARLDGPARRDVMMEAFSLGIYAPLAASAKTMRKDTASRLARNEGALEQAERHLDHDSQFDGVSDEELREDIERAALVAKRAETERLIAHHEAQLASMLDDLVDVDETQARMTELTTELASHDGALASALERVTEAKTVADDLNARVKSHQFALSGLQRRRDKITSVHSVCETCGQQMSDEVRTFALAEIDAQIEAVNEATEAASDRARSAQENLATARREHERIETIRRDISASMNAAANELRRAQYQGEAIEKARETLVSLRADRDAYSEVSVRYVTDDVRRELVVRDVAAQNAARAKQLRADIEADTVLMSNLDLLVAAYSPSGIPMATLRGVSQEISDDANTTLDLMGSQLRVRLDAHDASVDIEIASEGMTSGWSRLSGQERFYVALALRRSLTRAVSRRTGLACETLLIDEGWGALDHDHAQRAVEALVSITRDVAVLTVTHIEAVSDQLPQRIDVNATVGTSSAHVVA